MHNEIDEVGICVKQSSHRNKASNVKV